MAYITTAEVKEIRKALKVEFGNKFKFSVTRRDCQQVTVAIMAGDADFSSMWSTKKADDYGHGYANVNQYYINADRYGDNAPVFAKINEIICSAPAKAEGGRAYFDESDSQTDYFHCAFYYEIAVGKWDRPYVNTAA
jgi:hypothetical protein